jgi:hypothetical protein
VSSTPHLRKEIEAVTETLCSLEYRTMDKSKNPVIPRVIHRLQNPLESTRINMLDEIMLGVICIIFQSFGHNLRFGGKWAQCEKCYRWAREEIWVEEDCFLCPMCRKIEHLKISYYDTIFI